jgi:ABC-type multidrug transport system fused ATPase/permease subunit
MNAMTETPAAAPDAPETPAAPRAARTLSPLRMLMREGASYPGEVAIALTALLITSGATIAIPASFKSIIDKAFGPGANAETINGAFRWLLLVVLILGIGTAVRFYFVSWLGERVVADIRLKVQANLLRMPPSFFESNSPKEISSRMTSDTTLIEQVAGTTVSVALRNGITALGIAVAMGMLYTLLAFDRGYQQGLTTELDRLGAHVLVVPKGCPYDAASIALHGARWPCYLKDAYLKEVAANEGVASAAPILMNATWDEKSESQVVYCGITAEMLKLRRQWKPAEGAVLPTAGMLVAGSDIAKTNGWKVGQTVSLPGIDKQMLTVGGILAPTASPDAAPMDRESKVNE